jgi:uncharacterized membrane protein
LISQPNLYSVVVAFIAGVVGVVSILQARASALLGVFFSVTTIPVAAAIGLSVAFDQWKEAKGATEQLILDVVTLLAVGVVALVLQRRFWKGRESGQRTLDPASGAGRGDRDGPGDGLDAPPGD